MKVSLRVVDEENRLACVALKVAASQRGFLPSNLSSITGAQLYPDARSRAIYAVDELVGYLLSGIDETTGLWKLFRLMIDQTFQGLGYGKAAMEVMLDEIRQEKAEVVLVRYDLDNEVAIRLYERFAFTEISRTETHATAQCLLEQTP